MSRWDLRTIIEDESGISHLLATKSLSYVPPAVDASSNIHRRVIPETSNAQLLIEGCAWLKLWRPGKHQKCASVWLKAWELSRDSLAVQDQLKFIAASWTPSEWKQIEPTEQTDIRSLLI
jgi:hypothetical protein